MPTTEKQKVSIEVKRVDGQIVFSFKVPKMLEDIYRSKSVEERTSDNWAGNKFYYIPGIVENEAYKSLLEQYGLFDNYGAGLVNQHGKFNVSFLRTVGGEGTIPLEPQLSFARLSEEVRNLTRFVRAYYEQFVGPFKIGGTIEFEIE